MAKLFTTTRMLRFGDCDISGTAYFPTYLDILNGVHEEFWDSIGYPWHHTIWKERWGTPTVHLTCDFAKPSFFGDELTFHLRVIKVGRTSMTLKHRISCGFEERWVCTQIVAASDLDKHRARPWPDEVRELLLEYIES